MPWYLEMYAILCVYEMQSCPLTSLVSGDEFQRTEVNGNRYRRVSARHDTFVIVVVDNGENGTTGKTAMWIHSIVTYRTTDWYQIRCWQLLKIVQDVYMHRVIELTKKAAANAKVILLTSSLNLPYGNQLCWLTCIMECVPVTFSILKIVSLKNMGSFALK